VLQSEVGDPGRVVEAGESRPRPGDADGVAGGPELEDLRQELREGEGGGGDRGVREDATTITRFESDLADIPEVRQAERLFGDPDYLIRVATADLAAYQALRDEKLAALPGVQRLSSTIVMKRVVDDRPYPVAPASDGRRHSR
jgi:Lrp/AsnC ligand binding domain